MRTVLACLVGASAHVIVHNYVSNSALLLIRATSLNCLCVGAFVSGGFTTAWAVSQTDRFKCGVMGAGYGDWAAFQGKAALCGEPKRWIPGEPLVNHELEHTVHPPQSRFFSCEAEQNKN
eukprot:COSAG02_NODE_576_length_20112_cov_13.577625_7_plen_120_part_00